jgi:hypothetical protein
MNDVHGPHWHVLPGDDAIEVDRGACRSIASRRPMLSR